MAFYLRHTQATCLWGIWTHNRYVNWPLTKCYTDWRRDKAPRIHNCQFFVLQSPPTYKIKKIIVYWPDRTFLYSGKYLYFRCNYENIKLNHESYVNWTVHHLDSWIKRDQIDVTCFIISLFNAQHVSDVNTSILRSLRLICWVISWVVLLCFDVCWCYVVVRLGWCGIRM